MRLPQRDRIAELTDEMDTVEGFLLYWLTVKDPDLQEEAAGRIAVLETDLANLKREHKALVEGRNQHS
jgi:hypothetical protein